MKTARHSVSEVVQNFISATSKLIFCGLKKDGTLVTSSELIMLEFKKKTLQNAIHCKNQYALHL